MQEGSGRQEIKIERAIHKKITPKYAITADAEEQPIEQLSIIYKIIITIEEWFLITTSMILHGIYQNEE